jgi:hypothetical protein
MMTYKNISYLFASVLLFAFFAFYRSYFGLFPSFNGISMVIHFHAAVIILWFVMLIVQPILIRKGRPDVHRRIGRISYVLTPLIVLSFILMIRQTELKGKNIPVFAISVVNGCLFIAYYLLAIIDRKKVSWHIRFMVLTILPFIDPAAGRLHLPGLLIQILVILGLLIVERFNARIYKPYLIGLLVWTLIVAPMAYLLILNPQALNAVWNMFFN